MNCKGCGKQIVRRKEQFSEDMQTIADGKTYLIKKRKYKYSTRSYCRYCGAWKK